jgi:hypothetical protein
VLALLPYVFALNNISGRPRIAKIAYRHGRGHPKAFELFLSSKTAPRSPPYHKRSRGEPRPTPFLLPTLEIVNEMLTDSAHQFLIDLPYAVMTIWGKSGSKGVSSFSSVSHDCANFLWQPSRVPIRKPAPFCAVAIGTNCTRVNVGD